MQGKDTAPLRFAWYPSPIVMATSLAPRHLTDRDIEILVALDRGPLTVLQLLKLSQSFAHFPFGSPRSVQDRLHKLREAGWVQKWSYAIATRGSTPEYYKLTSLGYRLLYGQRASRRRDATSARSVSPAITTPMHWRSSSSIRSSPRSGVGFASSTSPGRTP